MNDDYDCETAKQPSESVLSMATLSPWRFDLFNLLRHIDAREGGGYPIGRAPLPQFDVVRLKQKPSLIFAPSTIASVRLNGTEQLKGAVSIFSFGLFGPNGPLPLYLTEYAHERIYHHQDSSFSAFTDLFHHRLISLFYRAWADAQPTVSLDREDDKRFEVYLASLIGMGIPGQMDKGTLGHHARYTFAGHLCRTGKDAEGLQNILRYYFQVPVKLIANVPRWMMFCKQDRLYLRSDSPSFKLGKDTFLGQSVRDVQHNFNIDIGPLSSSSYQRFLPDQSWCAELRDWVRQYSGISYQWHVRLIMRATDVIGITLGSSSRLGYDSWLGYQSEPINRDDFIFCPET